MLQISRVTALTVFEVLKENQLGGGEVKLHPPTQIRVNGVQSVRLEKGTIEFRNYFKQIPVLLKI